jgi:iron(III)-enterobactin esterase
MRLSLRHVVCLSFAAFAFPGLASAQERKPDRPTPPTRPFDAPGAPKFTRLDGKPGVNPPVDAEGDFVIGPDYVPAPETKVVEGVPQGKVQQFQIDSKDCKLFNPGIARDVFGIVDPNNPKTLIVETHPIDYKRTVTVYVPAQYVAGTAAPFIVTHDGPALGKPDMNLRAHPRQPHRAEARARHDRHHDLQRRRRRPGP